MSKDIRPTFLKQQNQPTNQNFNIEAIKAAIKERDDDRENTTVKAIEKLTEILMKNLIKPTTDNPTTTTETNKIPTNTNRTNAPNEPNKPNDNQTKHHENNQLNIQTIQPNIVTNTTTEPSNRIPIEFSQTSMDWNELVNELDTKIMSEQSQENQDNSEKFSNDADKEKMAQFQQLLEPSQLDESYQDESQPQGSKKKKKKKMNKTQTQPPKYSQRKSNN